MLTTPGRILVEQALPEPYRGRQLKLDAPGIKALFQEIAERHPDQYAATARRLTRIGGEVAYASGGFSFDLDDAVASPAVQLERHKIDQAVQRILADPAHAGDPQARDAAIVKVLAAAQKPLEQLAYREALAAQNPLALQVASGTRGKPMNLKSLLAGDLMYEDHRGQPVPVPITRSYAEGLTPAQYWAGTYGARQGLYSVKKGTADSGYLAKVLAASAHDLLVTQLDRDDDASHDHLGLPVATADADSAGALLARPVGGYARNARITPRVLADLQARGIDQILVRSPITGGPPGGGVYARDVGFRERGGLSPRGDYVGIAAAQAISEKITQGALSSKHAGGVAGESKVASGFGYVSNLLNPPKTFPGVAVHAQESGTVSDVRPAPHGGHFVMIGAKQQHVPVGHSPVVRPGDPVSAGDVLCDGPPNPAEVVRFKGIGEGRRYLTTALRDAIHDMGQAVNRRNLEILATATVNHVRLTDEHQGHPPDAIVRYGDVVHGYEPRPDAQTLAPRKAVGQYLERPALHHAVGDRVTRAMAAELDRFGIGEVHVHHDPPPWEPTFVRGVDAMAHHPDWMTQHLGSGLKKSTLRAAHHGAVSDASGPSYVPAIAERSRFGTHGLTQGYVDFSHLPRDGDGDGYIYDGTPLERPDPRRRRPS